MARHAAHPDLGCGEREPAPYPRCRPAGPGHGGGLLAYWSPGKAVPDWRP